MHETLPRLLPTDFPAITRHTLSSLQVNLGYRCNQTCLHCHVNAGPRRKETMVLDDINLLLKVVDKLKIESVDLTGGAPELNEHFRYLVSALRARDVKVIDRCNLTILSEPNQTDLAQFLADNQVEIYASLPCYTPDNVDKQRGSGVFSRSIYGLKDLNRLGYGQQDSGLSLNLVYNPLGATLPPPQSELESKYKDELMELFGIFFNQLFVIANMPIQRFGSMLISHGEFDSYLDDIKNVSSRK